MRLFVAGWPTKAAIAAVAGLHRPDIASVRWTSQEQWHVTLRFLGDVGAEDVPALVASLAAVRRQPSRAARLGPATALLASRTLMVPVAGVDDLAATTVAATSAFGAAPADRFFTGHLTLARGRGRRPVPAELAGQPVEARWLVDRVSLVRSHLGAGGARYETLATVALEG